MLYLFYRKVHGESTSRAVFTVDVDVATVALDDTVRDVEAEPRAAFFLREKRFENPMLVFLREPEPIVTNLDDNKILYSVKQNVAHVNWKRKRHFHRATGRGCFDGVLDEVYHDLRDPIRVH